MEEREIDEVKKAVDMYILSICEDKLLDADIIKALAELLKARTEMMNGNLATDLLHRAL